MYLNISSPLLQATVEAIVEKINPEKIILLGSRKYNEQINNTFCQITMPDTITGYQLLILLSPRDKRDVEELYKSVNKEFPYGTSVTSIIIPVDVFNQWLQKGHLLAHNTYHTKNLVYDTGKFMLVEPGIYDLKAICDKIQTECSSWVETATQLKEGATFYKQSKQFKLGAFLLHQTAEQSLMAIIRLVTGYRAGTHDLPRLLMYAHVFCGVPYNVFSDSKQEHKWLLKLLQGAYIGSRYKNDFELTEQQFLMLEQGVQALLVYIKEAAIKFHTGYNKQLGEQSSPFFTALIN
jgi:HEPN domain-containing protein